jgi:hypothetical protein
LQLRFNCFVSQVKLFCIVLCEQDSKSLPHFEI